MDATAHGKAEADGTFDRAELDGLLSMAVAGIATLDSLQRSTLGAG